MRDYRYLGVLPIFPSRARCVKHDAHIQQRVGLSPSLRVRVRVRVIERDKQNRVRVGVRVDRLRKGPAWL